MSEQPHEYDGSEHYGWPQEHDNREDDIVKAETVAHALNDSVNPDTLDGFRMTRARIDDIGEKATKLATTGELDVGEPVNGRRVGDEIIRFQAAQAEAPDRRRRGPKTFFSEPVEGSWRLEERLATTGYDDEVGRTGVNSTGYHQKNIDRHRRELAIAEARGYGPDTEREKARLKYAEQDRTRDTEELLATYVEQQAGLEKGIDREYQELSAQAARFETFYDLNPDKFAAQSPKEFLGSAKEHFRLQADVGAEKWGVERADTLSGEYNELLARMESDDYAISEVTFAALDNKVRDAFGVESHIWTQLGESLEGPDGDSVDVAGYASPGYDLLARSPENAQAYIALRGDVLAQYSDTTPRQLVAKFGEFARAMQGRQEKALGDSQSALDANLTSITATESHE